MAKSGKRQSGKSKAAKAKAKPASRKANPVKAKAKPKIAAAKAGPKPASKFNGRFNRPGKPGRGAPPPKIGRAAKGLPSKAAASAPKKPSRQRVRICKQEDCNTPQTTQGYCRLHYLQNWKALREEKAKRAQKNLDRYVERMAGAKKPNPDEEEQQEGGAQKEEAVFEEDFGEFVDVLSREENLDKILNGIKVEDY